MPSKQSIPPLDIITDSAEQDTPVLSTAQQPLSAWQLHYHQCLQQKKDYILHLLTKSSSKEQQFLPAEQSLSTEFFDQQYEALVSQLNARLGYRTQLFINPTTSDRVFLRTPLPARNSTESLLHRAKPLENAKEIFQLKILHELKTAIQFAEQFIYEATDELDTLKEDLFEHYQCAVNNISSLDLQATIMRPYKNFNAHTALLLLNTPTINQLGISNKKQIHRLLDYRKVWANLTYQPHDICTLDTNTDTFELELSSATLPIAFMLDMATIATDGKSQQTILDFIKQKMPKMRFEALADEIEQYLSELQPNTLPAWYRAAVTSNQAAIWHYAHSSQMYQDFCCVPAKLADNYHDGHNHPQKSNRIPIGLRGFFTLVEGCIINDGGICKAIISGQSYRSGAPSRTGSTDISEQNHQQLIGAMGSTNQATVSASLLTGIITSIAKFKALIKGKKANEPDRFILQAQQKLAQLNANHQHRYSALLLKSHAKILNPDPFKMISRFRTLKLNNEAELLLTVPGLKATYVQLQKLAEPFDTDIKAWWLLENQFLRRLEEIKLLVGQLQQTFLASKSLILLQHLRLIDALICYQIINANFIKKIRIGRKSQAIIMTPLEYFSEKRPGKAPLEQNQYDQWLLAFENIIGYHYHLLAQLTHPLEQAQYQQILTHFYCKDGRDRAGMTAILYKFLIKRFDIELSTRINHPTAKKPTNPGIIMLPLEPTPLKNQHSATELLSFEAQAQLFKQQHDEVVQEHGSSLLNGSPESSIGDFGLLPKLEGAAFGLIASTIAPVRSSLSSLLLDSSELFSTSRPYFRSPQPWE